MRRVSIAVLVALATVSCGRLDEGADPGASGPPVENPGITAACGGSRFPTLPPDPSSFPPFEGWGDVDLSEIGTESEFFDAYTWSIAEETSTTLQLFGTPRSRDTTEPLYASAGFEAEEGQWRPIGWGDCRMELSAPGWGNARFVLDPEIPPDADAATISVLATEMACASGQAPTDRDVRAVVLDETDESVSIVVLVKPTEGDANCQGNPSFPLHVALPSPLGERHVLDASVYPPDEVSVGSSGTTGTTDEPQSGTAPPASGYWIAFADAPEPVGGGSDGAVRIRVLTNLPDGTLVLANTDRGGMCCPPVMDGRIVIEASSSACGSIAGDHAPGISITITVVADVGQHVLGVPLGGQPPQQPDSVLAILGPHFENLTGDQVVERNGAKELVASVSYAWSEPLCLQ